MTDYSHFKKGDIVEKVTPSGDRLRGCISSGFDNTWCLVEWHYGTNRVIRRIGIEHRNAIKRVSPLKLLAEVAQEYD